MQRLPQLKFQEMELMIFMFCFVFLLTTEKVLGTPFYYQDYMYVNVQLMFQAICQVHYCCF